MQSIKVLSRVIWASAVALLVVLCAAVQTPVFATEQTYTLDISKYETITLSELEGINVVSATLMDGYSAVDGAVSLENAPYAKLYLVQETASAIANTITVASGEGHWVFLSGVNLNSANPVVVQGGRVQFTLQGENTITATSGAAIAVSMGAQISVDGDGTLWANGASGAPGIGVKGSASCGKIALNGGIIYAAGGSGSVDIGANSGAGEGIALGGGSVFAQQGGIGGDVTMDGFAVVTAATISGNVDCTGGVLLLPTGGMVGAKVTLLTQAFSIPTGYSLAISTGQAVQILEGGNITVQDGASLSFGVGASCSFLSDGAIAVQSGGNLSVDSRARLTLNTGTSLIVQQGAAVAVATDATVAVPAQGAIHLGGLQVSSESGFWFGEGKTVHYADSVLTIADDTAVIIENVTAGAAVGDVIVITAPLATPANITLNGVHLVHSSASPFVLSQGSGANITLADGTENIFVGATLAQADGGAGMEVPSGAGLVIQGGATGTGVLTAQGNGYSAGIGGNRYQDGGDVTILGGQVHAEGNDGGAGIGGGANGSGGNVVISGGVVYATALAGDALVAGAGIGAGAAGTGGSFGIGNALARSGGTGGAFVVASSITDTSYQTKVETAGVVLLPNQDPAAVYSGRNAGNGYLYGGSYTLGQAARIPGGYTLTVKNGQIFTVAEDTQLSIEAMGALVVANKGNFVYTDGSLEKDVDGVLIYQSAGGSGGSGGSGSAGASGSVESTVPTSPTTGERGVVAWLGSLWAACFA
ncbi:MAG: hypothetical protein R3Y06_00690 [Faecalibacterium sp.]